MQNLVHKTSVLNCSKKTCKNFWWKMTYSRWSDEFLTKCQPTSKTALQKNTQQNVGTFLRHKNRSPMSTHWHRKRETSFTNLKVLNCTEKICKHIWCTMLYSRWWYVLLTKCYTTSKTASRKKHKTFHKHFGTSFIGIQIQGRTNRRNAAKTSVDRITGILSYLQ